MMKKNSHKGSKIIQLSAEASLEKAYENFHAGKIKEAEILCLSLLKKNPDQPALCQLLGLIYCHINDWENGISFFKKSLLSKSLDPAYFFNLGTAYCRLKNYRDALLTAKKSVILSPYYAASWSVIGECFIQNNILTYSEKAFYRAVILEPTSGLFQSQLGITTLKLGSSDYSAKTTLKAILLDPSLALPYAYYSATIKKNRHYAKNIDYLKRTIILDNDCLFAINEIIIYFNIVDKSNEAIQFFKALIVRIPHIYCSYNSLAIAYQAQNSFSKAITYYKISLLISPHSPETHLNLAYSLLAHGDFLEGWREHEWRWDCAPLIHHRRVFTQDLWDGSSTLYGRLFIHAEQGFGDTIQFCRYLPLIHQKGWKIIVEVPAPLKRLIASMPYIDQIISPGDPVPNFDKHCPLLSLPYRFKTEVSSIPSFIPYLSGDKHEKDFWNKTLTELCPPHRSILIKIGIVWEGRPRDDIPELNDIGSRRILHPHRLNSLLDCPHVQFFSLQKDPSRRFSDPRLIDLTEKISDFSDSAAFMNSLDLVISVDTAVAHLAGALGKEIWLMDRYDPCWRWLPGRLTSPWYPSMRIFRQEKRYEWQSVLDDIKEALIDKIEWIKKTEILFGKAIQSYENSLYSETENYCHTIQIINPIHAGSLHLLGLCAYHFGNHQKGISYIEKSITQQPLNCSCQSDLSFAYLQNGDYQLAHDNALKALSLDPHNADAHCNLAVAQDEIGELEKAKQSYIRAITLNPEKPVHYFNLAIIRENDDRTDEAIALYKKAISLKPYNYDAINNLANCLKLLGLFDEAILTFELALKYGEEQLTHLKTRDDDLAHIHTNLSLIYLTIGNFEKGWPEYEWRWRTKQLNVASRHFNQPQWKGEQSHGRTLFIYEEQGFGDSLQFCRYATMAAHLGWKVILEVPKPLLRLLNSLDSISKIITSGDPIPEFDFHCPMMSLPYAFKTNFETIPSLKAYLYAQPQRVEKWKKKLEQFTKHRLRVGVSWAGNPRLISPHLAAVDRRRSIDPHLLRPLFDQKDILFVSLQKQAGLISPPTDIELIDWMDEIEDFEDSAALISSLDLVISVDTAIVHLAGAIGKPVWMLDRFDSCWRWLRGQDYSPWYPQLRLFRQTVSGDWSDVISNILEAMSYLKNNHALTESWFLEAIKAYNNHNYPSAKILCHKILNIIPHHAGSIHILGLIICYSGHPKEALPYIKKSVELQPKNLSPIKDLSFVALEAKEYEKALIAAQKALELKADYSEAHCYLGVAQEEKGDKKQAALSYLKAIILDPNHPLYYYNLAILKENKTETMRQAVTLYQRSIKIDPLSLNSRNNLANCLRFYKRFEEAIAICREALLYHQDDNKEDINRANLHFTLSINLLSIGDYASGWREYEWRWKTSTLKGKDRQFDKPQWRGEPAHKRRLFIYEEGGYGDSLQFCRYALLAAKLGWSVILEVRPALVDLMKQLSEITEVIETGQPLPFFDFHCGMLSLPAAFPPTQKVPWFLYLKADPYLIQQWSKKLIHHDSQLLRVGLVWSGNPQSIPFDRIDPELFKPLFKHQSILFMSLQKMISGIAIPHSITLIDWMNDIKTFADSAALISNLDLVISVDTSVVHLTGGLGIPVWMITQYDAGWRWIHDRIDSPWYPSLTLFQQKTPVHLDEPEASLLWEDVIDKIDQSLWALEEIFINIRQNKIEKKKILSLSFSEIMILLRWLCHTSPSEPPFYSIIAEIGLLLQEHHRYDDAIYAYQLALHHKPEMPSLYINLGILHRHLKQYELCYKNYKIALLLEPHQSLIYYNFGYALDQDHRLNEALLFYRLSIQINPYSNSSYNNSGLILEKLGQSHLSSSYYVKALIVHPSSYEALHNYANALREDHKIQQALLIFLKLLYFQPSYSENYSHCASVFYLLTHLELAQKYYILSLILDPANQQHKFNLSLTFLGLGDYKKGWELYESRWFLDNMMKTKILSHQREWQGQEGHGKTILVYAEQGFGDSIQFCRYSSLLVKKGWHVILQVPHELKSLFQTLHDIDHIIDFDDPAVLYDCHIPMLSLPRFLQSDKNIIPSNHPYLFPQKDKIEKWQNLLKTSLIHQKVPSKTVKVGICCSGNPRLMDPLSKKINLRRSIDPIFLEPLFSIPNLLFFNLQKDNLGETLPSAINLMDKIDDFHDTAALMMSLDLIITVDTSILHLAGAIGKPVWLLDRFDTCWRWSLDDKKSSWYPSLKIFRQTEAGHWSDVIQKVKKELKKYCTHQSDHKTL
jgi:tetratricopeptide (TPR) repeat protein